MSDTTTTDERDGWIARAQASDITLSRTDFRKIDGDWTLDGMDPDEWLDVLTAD